jgi:hypothetical protein
VRLYVVCWLLVAVLALSSVGILVLAVHLQRWSGVGPGVFWLAWAGGLGWYLRAHPPID